MGEVGVVEGVDGVDGGVLGVEGLSKDFPLRGPFPWSRLRGVARAVSDVSFVLGAGRTLGLVGESGCGKSTIARMVWDLEVPSGGRVLFRGEDVAGLRGRGYSEYRTNVLAVFQDPVSAQNPRRRVGALVGEPLVVNLGLRGEELRGRVAELLESVGLEARFASSFPHELSGGMRQRVAVATALALNPAVIVLDEPVSALDVSFRSQILNLLKDLQAERGMAYLLISHDLATVRYVCDDVAALYLGRVVEKGPAGGVFDLPLHPYTIALLDAARWAPDDVGARERIVLKGEVGSPTDIPEGCAFAPRCWLREALGDPEECVGVRPELRVVEGSGEGQVVACHFSEELVGSARAGLIASASGLGAWSSGGSEVDGGVG